MYICRTKCYFNGRLYGVGDKVDFPAELKVPEHFENLDPVVAPEPVPEPEPVAATPVEEPVAEEKPEDEEKPAPKKTVRKTTRTKKA